MLVWSCKRLDSFLELLLKRCEYIVLTYEVCPYILSSTNSPSSIVEVFILLNYYLLWLE